MKIPVGIFVVVAEELFKLTPSLYENFEDQKQINQPKHRWINRRAYYSKTFYKAILVKCVGSGTRKT